MTKSGPKRQVVASRFLSFLRILYVFYVVCLSRMVRHLNACLSNKFTSLTNAYYICNRKILALVFCSPVFVIKISKHCYPHEKNFLLLKSTKRQHKCVMQRMPKSPFVVGLRARTQAYYYMPNQGNNITELRLHEN